MKPKTDWKKALLDITQRNHAAKVSELEAQNKELVDALAAMHGELDVAIGIGAGKVKPVAITGSQSRKDEATAFAIASDWHVEETVDGKSVNGLNEFNLDIADARISAFFRNIVKLTNVQRNATEIPNLVLVLGGDLMTGYIHEELQETNALSPTETVLWLRDRIVGGIDYLMEDGGFNRIVIPCVYGNHGRTTKKPRHATGARNSYEWMLYNFLAKHYAGNDAVEFLISDGYHLYLDVYGQKIRVHHGDGLKYQGGIGGLTIPVEKAIASWNKAIPAALDIFGHWHQSQQNPKWICNGSLIGFNAYSIAIKAPFESPSQTYFLFDSRRGRTGTFPIFLD